MPKKLPPAWLMVTLWWLICSVILANSVISVSVETGQKLAWIEAFKQGFAGWASWIPISLPIVWIVRNFSFRRKHFLKPFLILNFTAASAALFRVFYFYFSNPIFGWYDHNPKLLELIGTVFHSNFILAWIFIGVTHTIFFFQNARIREREILELKEHLTREKLRALSAQLNPHFLFNALNSIAELIHIDQTKADNMLVSLSTLLRRCLSDSEKQEISLKDEIELTKHYIEIEKIRLADRMSVVWKVESDCVAAYVPAFILQPLVENAIVHSISKSYEKSELLIAVKKAEGQMLISVENNGRINQHSTRGHGTGLNNMRERLKCLYGNDRSSVELTELDGNRVGVLIRIPVLTSREATLQMKVDTAFIADTEDMRL